MNLALTILAALSSLLAVMPFIRPRSSAGEALVWLPKLVGGALSPVCAAIGGVAALVGLASRDWWLAGIGLLSFGLAVSFLRGLPEIDSALAGIPHPASQSRAPGAPPRTGAPAGRPRGAPEREVVFGHNARTGQPLLADLWLPASGRCSGLGLIYAHGSGWRLGSKDMGTRPFFRRLTAQGHLVLDIAYSLWPAVDLPAMVAEVNQAILWLKEHGPDYGVGPEHVVVMGGSAGGHLALLAAYTPGHPAFRPAGASGDTRVRAAVAFYPPVDLLYWENEAAGSTPPTPGLIDRAGQSMMRRLFTVRDESGQIHESDNIVAEMLGGTAAEIPDTYWLLSPSHHAGTHCPPTLLLQGSDDVFRLAPAVRRLHEKLTAAGVPSALMEFPRAEHAFDLLLPRLSPLARTSTRAVEKFLARVQSWG